MTRWRAVAVKLVAAVSLHGLLSTSRPLGALILSFMSSDTVARLKMHRSGENHGRGRYHRRKNE